MKLRGGHAPAHVRETACNAFWAWLDSEDGTPEPTVEYEINYIPRQIPISRALGLVWNCDDILPGALFELLYEVLEAKGYAPRRQTYGACAQAILTLMKYQTAA